MQFAQRQPPLPAKWRPVAVAVVVGLLLGLAGPFGSYPAYSTATRYAFWLGLTAAGVVAAIAADALLSATKFRAGAVRIGALALVSAVPMTFVVAWTMSIVQPGRTFAPHQLPTLFACVAAVQLLIVYATKVTAPNAETSAPAPAPPVLEADAVLPAFPPALLSKLPPGIGSDILALETEDHYLRVHAAGGSALILMRMADAVALIDPRLGAQVHRRWWVAEGAVKGVRMEGQRLWLCLADKSEVPVGRTFATAVKARFAAA
jgi:DNA-binding LytR/AlgR family response regulator